MVTIINVTGHIKIFNLYFFDIVNLTISTYQIGMFTIQYKFLSIFKTLWYNVREGNEQCKKAKT
jgi:hypothetical protein